MAIPAALTVALLVSNAQVEGEASLRAETRGGHRPLRASGDPEGVFELELNPGARLILEDAGGELTLAYEPRVLQRAPSPLDRPLILHRADLTSRLALSRELSLRASSRLSFGETDYGAYDEALLLQRDEAGAVPDLEVLSSLGASGELELRHRPDPRVELEYGAGVAYTAPRASTAAQLPEDLFPKSVGLHGHAGSWFELTRLDRIGGRLSMDWSRLSTGRRYSTPGVALAYGRRASRDLEFGLDAGAQLVLASDADERLMPTASVEVRSVLLRDRALFVEHRLRAAIESALDPVLGTVRPRLSSSSATSVVFSPELRMDLWIFFSTPATKETAVPDRALAFEETFLSVELPVSLRLAQGLALEFGIRGAARGPHLADPEFDLGRPELVGFVAISGEVRSPLAQL